MPSSADKLDSNDYDSEESTDVLVPVNFEEEVEATIMRAVDENIKVRGVISEINCLRFLSMGDKIDPTDSTEAIDFADYAEAIFHTMMKLSLGMPHNSANESRQNVASVLNTWPQLLMFYTEDVDDHILILLKFEEMCLESTKELSPYFPMIMPMLYDKDILTEDAILRWADEKKDAEESD